MLLIHGHFWVAKQFAQKSFGVVERICRLHDGQIHCSLANKLIAILLRLDADYGGCYLVAISVLNNLATVILFVPVGNARVGGLEVDADYCLCLCRFNHLVLFFVY